MTVDLDRDVYEYLREHSTFEDTVSTVLRRELRLVSTVGTTGGSPSQGSASSPAAPSRGRRIRAHRAPSTGRRRAAGGGRRTRAASGTLLPEREYHRPILEILVEHGGSASKQEVIEEISRRLEGRLTEADLSPLASGGIRWMSRVQFARLRLADRGLIDKDMPRGTWKITADGVRALEEGAV
ncbi:MAG: winged helix-turn-helix domain-containing protein [Gaiellaceae bacterium]